MQVMKRLATILSIAALAALVSCRETVFTPRPTIPLVYEILQDTSGLKGVVKSYRSDIPGGSIAVIGPSEKTILLAESLLTADFVNNIDGSSREDLLPDFSGEHIDLLLDPVNDPYEKFLPDETDGLRDAAVRLSVFAMDTLCRLNPYSADNLRRKSGAKVLVFSSTLMSGWGQFDVDTLIQLAGGRPLTLSPVQALLEEALIGGDKVNIGVWASAQVAESGVYEAVHAGMRSSSALRVLTPREGDDDASQFRSFLSQYRRAGFPLPMHVLLLDEFGAPASEIMAMADSIRAGFSEEDLAMAKVLAPDFRVVEATSALCHSCYRMLRRENLFTHNISYPVASLYRTEKDHDGTMVLVELSPRYLPQSLDEFMDAFAVNLRRFYVSDND